MDRVIFLSDVHLSEARPERTRRFLAFLDTLRGNTRMLFLLGDLFEYWMGPAHLAVGEHHDTLRKLRELTADGMDVRFVRGNRDFHVAREFERATGVRVMGEGDEITLGRERVLLTHGDELCTEDTGYMVWRRLVRAPWAMSLYRALPSFLALAIARRARATSERNAARRGGRIQSFAPAALRRVFRRGYDRIICGHLHRAVTRTIPVPGDRAGTLMVLGEWDATGSYIEWDGCAFHHREVDLAGFGGADPVDRA